VAASIGREHAASHESFLRYAHYRWAKAAAALTAIVLLAYALVDVEPRHNGGSWFGYTLGTIGFVLILWLAMLGIRKRAITRGRWSLKAWTSAHVWLGLALIVIGTLHTGFQLGWNVHTLAWALMMLVILSGLYGAVVYAALPRSLSDSRAEMTRGQMIDAIASLDRQIESAAMPLSDEPCRIVHAAIRQDMFRGGPIARLSGRYPGCSTAGALDRLGAIGGEAEPAMSEVRALLERRAAALARLRAHMRTKALLEIWLFVHVPATIALIAALIAHVIAVFFYW